MTTVVMYNSVCSAKFVYVLVKIQLAITFALIIETGQILYRFWIEFNFLCNAYYGSAVVFVVQNFYMFLVKLQMAITFDLVIETGQILY